MSRTNIQMGQVAPASFAEGNQLFLKSLDYWKQMAEQAQAMVKDTVNVVKDNNTAYFKNQVNQHSLESLQDPQAKADIWNGLREQMLADGMETVHESELVKYFDERAGELLKRQSDELQHEHNQEVLKQLRINGEFDKSERTLKNVKANFEFDIQHDTANVAGIMAGYVPLIAKPATELTADEKLANANAKIKNDKLLGQVLKYVKDVYGDDPIAGARVVGIALNSVKDFEDKSLERQLKQLDYDLKWYNAQTARLDVNNRFVVQTENNAITKEKNENDNVNTQTKIAADMEKARQEQEQQAQEFNRSVIAAKNNEFKEKTGFAIFDETTGAIVPSKVIAGITQVINKNNTELNHNEITKMSMAEIQEKFGKGKDPIIMRKLVTSLEDKKVDEHTRKLVLYEYLTGGLLHDTTLNYAMIKWFSRTSKDDIKEGIDTIIKRFDNIRSDNITFNQAKMRQIITDLVGEGVDVEAFFKQNASDFRKLKGYENTLPPEVVSIIDEHITQEVSKAKTKLGIPQTPQEAEKMLRYGADYKNRPAPYKTSKQQRNGGNTTSKPSTNTSKGKGRYVPEW